MKIFGYLDDLINWYWGLSGIALTKLIVVLAVAFIIMWLLIKYLPRGAE